jgi:uncharacterized RDD family membrane protein YckC
MEEILDSVKEDTKQNLATQGQRFLNLWIDSIVITVLTIAIIVIFGLFEYGDVVDTIKLILVALLYYTLLEFYFGKTIGKLLTKTTVKTEIGLKPNFSQCVQRSLSRLILLEVFSFIAQRPIG